ncbi:MAG: CHASE3 domain-containing protein [Bacteroidota bacterium]
MPKKIQFAIDNKTLAGFIFLLLILTGIEWFTFRTTNELIDNTKLVNHTHTILTKLELVFSFLKDAESGQRGYMITNDSAYMETYKMDNNNVKNEIAELMKLTGDNPKQQQQIITIDSLVGERYNRMEATLLLQKEKGHTAMAEQIMTREENRIMDMIRKLINTMKEDENHLLTLHTNQTDVSAKRTIEVMLVTGCISIIIIFLGLYFINRDNIKRKIAEQELNRFFTLSLDMMCIVGADGYFKRINPAFEDVLGYTQEELFSRPYHEFLHPDDKTKTIEAVRNMNKEGSKLAIENRCIRKDGTFRWLAWKAVPIDDVRYASARDITEQKMAAESIKKMNEELENRVELRTAELKRSNEELQQFAYVASHDLQEPLRMVASYVQLLEKKYKGQLDEKADTYIGFAVDGASRMKALINDLLDFSRVDSKAKSMKPTDMNETIEEVTHNLKMAIKENKASVEVIGNLPTIIAESIQMVQLFQNIINNAIKFKGEKTPIIRISSEELKDKWLFTIRDNGIGIEKEYWDRIFIIFQRLNNREEYPGTGIGLSICRKIVERHEGKIWLESEMGKGTTFHFTIHKFPINNTSS